MTRLNGCNWNGPRSHLVPWLFWAPRSLGPAWKSHVMIFVQGPIFSGPIFLRDQTSWGPNFLGTKKVRGPNEIGDHFSCSLIWFFSCPLFIYWISLPYRFVSNFLRRTWIQMASNFYISSSPMNFPKLIIRVVKEHEKVFKNQL